MDLDERARLRKLLLENNPPALKQKEVEVSQASV
jgi:hypothetical protein